MVTLRKTTRPTDKAERQPLVAAIQVSGMMGNDAANDHWEID
jgi:hypothetical protein